jgi:hypothetical protein
LEELALFFRRERVVGDVAKLEGIERGASGSAEGIPALSRRRAVEEKRVGVVPLMRGKG